MEKRISKSFRAIFGRLYPNFDENETQNSEEYFNFILKNYPDKSEVTQLKAFFVIFSFGLRKLFINQINKIQYCVLRLYCLERMKEKIERKRTVQCLSIV